MVWEEEGILRYSVDGKHFKTELFENGDDEFPSNINMNGVLKFRWQNWN